MLISNSKGHKEELFFTVDDLILFKSIQEAAIEDLVLPPPSKFHDSDFTELEVDFNDGDRVEKIKVKYVHPR